MHGRNRARALLNESSFVVLAIALGLSCGAQAAGLPQHGHFVGGQGSINKANRSVTVKQSSTTGIIDWKSFSVGKHSGVTFDNGTGATLNRVTGGNLSTIAGSLHASGTLYLMNSSGVIISGTGRVVTGGAFVASSGNIGNDAFQNDKLRITNGHADVINHGSIVAAKGVRLVGGDVSNTGSISASRVKLWARHQLAIGGEITAQRDNGAGGNVVADGHKIDVSGRIDASADAAHRKGGTVIIDARDTTTISGAVLADGGKHSEGGFIETSGKQVHVADGAKISTLASHGKTGTWLIDPTDFVIAPSGGDITGAQVSDMLATTSVFLTSSGGSGGSNGDVIVDDNVIWSSGSFLELDAYRNIVVEAPVTVEGSGDVILVYGDKNGTIIGNSAYGDLLFNGGRIAFTDVTSGNDTQLSINGQAYTLENDIAGLASDIATNTGTGFYALADNYDASGDNGGSAYAVSPIATLNGTFEGLGNTISNLKIDDTTDNKVGLFAENDGMVRDITLANASVTTNNTFNGGGGVLIGFNGGEVENAFSSGTISGVGYIGGLVGRNGGTVSDSGSSVNVTGGGNSPNAGGLVGLNSSTISGSYATGVVTIADGSNGNAGGLVGDDGSSIENSYATGAVTGGGNTSVGGLVGYSNGTVSASYATGSITGGSHAEVGGLVGQTSQDSPGQGAITGSFASGSVTGGADARIGGLVGAGNGTIAMSYATGAITGVGVDAGGLVGQLTTGGAVQKSYASGAVTGVSNSEVGGLVGGNDGTIQTSYAMGAVYGGNGADAGGLVGFNVGTVDESYETGAVTGSASAAVGALVGNNGHNVGDAAAVYYNSTANAEGAVGTGNSIIAGGGLTFASMELASNFSGWTFGTTGGGSGWVIVDQDGSLNNASGAGGTTPMLLTEYSTTITNAHQLQLMELDPTANYTLANDINAGATAGGDVWGSQGFIAIGGNNASGSFTGTFDGTSHTIANLTIDDSTNYYVGLFGESAGAIENVGLTNDNVTVGEVANVGGLVGDNGGGVVNSYATGAVTGGSYATVGGLVGLNAGAISQSHATGTVAGDTYASVGGLVGINPDGGTITRSYATDAVTAGDYGYAGGLLGTNDGAITRSYATGAVMSGANGYVGGFVGFNGGTIDESYALGAATGGSGGYLGGFVGYNQGSLGGTTAVYYNSDANPEGDSSTFTNGGGLTNAQMRDSSNFSGWNFGGLGSHADWVIVDQDGSLNNASGTTGGTTPMLLSEYSTTITNAHQLQLMELDPTADYTLANNIDASGTAGGDVWGSQGFIAVGGNAAANFSGTFDGLGNTISNLTISDAVNFTVGLIGESTGTVRDINLVNANVTSTRDLGDSYVGALIGQSVGGIVENAHVSGAVGSTAEVGGLIGVNGGQISDSSSSVNVTGTTSGARVGGLAGISEGSGTIEDSYATGTVSGSGQNVGGFVGLNEGTVSASYATGNVTGSGSTVIGGFVGLNEGGTIENSYAGGSVMRLSSGTGTGGFAGQNESGTITNSYSLGITNGAGFAYYNEDTITNSYWDTQTSGVNTDTSGAIGKTTAQLQGTLASLGFDNAVWAEVAGSFPYLQWQFGGATPTVISGKAFNASSGADVGDAVDIITGGSVAATTSTYADGTFYALIGSDISQGVGISIAGINALGVTDDSTVSSLFLHSDELDVWSGDANLSSLDGKIAATFGSTLGTPVTSLATLTTEAARSTQVFTSADFDLDEDLNIGSQAILFEANASMTQSAGGITADTLAVEDFHGDATLNGANHVAHLNIVQADEGNLAITDDESFTVDNAYAQGSIYLTASGTGNGMTIVDEGVVAGTTLTLTSGGGITETDGAIQAQTLTGSAQGTVTLNNAFNAVANLGAFTTSGHAFSFTNAAPLTVTGAVGTGTAALTLTTTGVGDNLAVDNTLTGGVVTLASAGTITQNSAGTITAASLTGSSQGAATLTASNVITDLGTFSTGGNAFSLTDDHDLTVNGTLDAAGHTVVLKTTGSGHDIAIDSKVEGSTVDLVSAATITENSSGDIDATKLEGSSTGNAEMNSAKNTITDLGTFTSGSTFELTDDHDLTVDGTIKASGHAVELTTKGSGHDINIDAEIEAKELKLVSAATITENKSGHIDVTTLTGSSAGNAEMNSSKNTIADLGAFTSKGAFELTDDHTLKVDGTVNAGTHTLDLKTIGKNHNLAIDAKIEGGTINLVTTGEATESKAGEIEAKLLNVTADTGIDLTSKKNNIKKLGTHKTKKGPNKVTL